MSFAKEMEGRLKHIPRVVRRQMTDVRRSRSNSRESKVFIRGFRGSKYQHEEPMQLQENQNARDPGRELLPHQWHAPSKSVGYLPVAEGAAKP